MLNFIYDHDEEISRFIGQLAPPAGGGFGRCKTIGVVDDGGNLIAGLVYFNYDPNAGVMEMGAAATTPRWFSRVTYRRMFEYPFIQCGCQMVFTRVRADNEALLSQFARMNFNLTYMPRMYGRDEDGVICTLTDDQWLDSTLAKWVYRDVRKKQEAA